MKYLIIIPLALILSACATKEVKLVAPEYKVIKAPDDFYKCPTVTKFPNPSTLTEKELGQLLVKQQRYNVTCKNNIEAIRKFYEDAEKTLAANKKS